jgi:hypothetical protein
MRIRYFILFNAHYLLLIFLLVLSIFYNLLKFISMLSFLLKFDIFLQYFTLICFFRSKIVLFFINFSNKRLTYFKLAINASIESCLFFTILILIFVWIKQGISNKLFNIVELPEVFIEN